MYVLTFTFPFMPDEQLYKKIGSRVLTTQSDGSDIFYTYSGAYYYKLIYNVRFRHLPERQKPLIKIVKL
jgi:hypothetical protein